MDISDTATALVIIAIILLSCLYTFAVVAKIPPGSPRLIASLPVFVANFCLPYAVDATKNTVFNIILTTYFGWWANFKVLALCWGSGPLQSLLPNPTNPHPPTALLPFFLFTSIYALPLVFKGIGPGGGKGEKKPETDEPGTASSAGMLLNGTPGGQGLVHRKTPLSLEPTRTSQVSLSDSADLSVDNRKDSSQSGPGSGARHLYGHERATWQSLCKQSTGGLSVFLLCLYLLDFRPLLPPLAVTAVYCLCMYSNMLFMFNAAAAGMEGVGGVEVCAHFRRPYLATSLQDFWGHRWNLVAGQLLKDSVYLPAKKTLQHLSTPFVPPPLRTPLSVLLTFSISGLMHELIIFNAMGAINGLTCEWFLFFTLHGGLLLVEIAIKKKWRALGWRELSPFVSIPFTLLILVTTAEMLFFPPVTRHGLDVRAISEYRGLMPGKPLY